MNIQRKLWTERAGLEEAKSVPLVRTGQGSYTKDTHPSDAERMYQAKDKKEYDKLMRDAEDAMRKGMLAKFGLVGDYKKFTVNIKFKDAKSRKKFEKMNSIKESVELDEAKFNRRDEPFTLVALKGKKVLETMKDIEADEVDDAMKYMKKANKGATISVEAKGGKVMHTEAYHRPEEEETEYEKFFKKAMKKFGVSSPAELKGEKKKEFYNYVDDNYKAKNEEVNEDDMSDEQKKKREEIVKALKKDKDDFEKRYGERAMDVMYATATKQAMKK